MSSDAGESRGVPDGGTTLAEYVDDHREDLEALAAAEYPLSPAIKAILQRRDRGEL